MMLRIVFSCTMVRKKEQDLIGDERRLEVSNSGRGGQWMENEQFIYLIFPGISLKIS